MLYFYWLLFVCVVILLCWYQIEGTVALIIIFIVLIITIRCLASLSLLYYYHYLINW